MTLHHPLCCSRILASSDSLKSCDCVLFMITQMQISPRVYRKMWMIFLLSSCWICHLELYSYSVNIKQHTFQLCLHFFFLGSNHCIRVLLTPSTSHTTIAREGWKWACGKNEKSHSIHTKNVFLLSSMSENQIKRVQPHRVRQRQGKTLIVRVHWVVEQCSFMLYRQMEIHTPRR